MFEEEQSDHDEVDHVSVSDHNIDNYEDPDCDPRTEREAQVIDSDTVILGTDEEEPPPLHREWGKLNVCT